MRLHAALSCSPSFGVCALRRAVHTSSPVKCLQSVQGMHTGILETCASPVDSTYMPDHSPSLKGSREDTS